MGVIAAGKQNGRLQVADQTADLEQLPVEAEIGVAGALPLLAGGVPFLPFVIVECRHPIRQLAAANVVTDHTAVLPALAVVVAVVAPGLPAHDYALPGIGASAAA